MLISWEVWKTLWHHLKPTDTAARSFPQNVCAVRSFNSAGRFPQSLRLWAFKGRFVWEAECKEHKRRGENFPLNSFDFFSISESPDFSCFTSSRLVWGEKGAPSSPGGLKPRSCVYYTLCAAVWDLKPKSFDYTLHMSADSLQQCSICCTATLLTSCTQLHHRPTFALQCLIINIISVIIAVMLWTTRHKNSFKFKQQELVTSDKMIKSSSHVWNVTFRAAWTFQLTAVQTLTSLCEQLHTWTVHNCTGSKGTRTGLWLSAGNSGFMVCCYDSTEKIDPLKGFRSPEMKHKEVV